MRVAPALAAEVEFFADLEVGLVALGRGEGRGGEHPAADLVDAFEVHLGEGLVAQPRFHVVWDGECLERDFGEWRGEERRALTVLVLLDARGLVVGLADVDAAEGVLERVDARGGSGLFRGRGRVGVAEAASGQAGAVQVGLGVARADKVACPAAAEAEAAGGLGGFGGPGSLTGRDVVELVVCRRVVVEGPVVVQARGAVWGRRDEVERGGVVVDAIGVAGGWGAHVFQMEVCQCRNYIIGS